LIIFTGPPASGQRCAGRWLAGSAVCEVKVHINRKLLLPLVIFWVGASVAGSAQKKAWNVDEETRKMVKFETGRETVLPKEDSNDKPPVKRYYGPETPAKMLAHMKATGRRTTWIENGVLYVDGKPCLRRNLYGVGYLCSKQHLERLTKTDDPGCTWEMTGVGIEFGRLVPGSEEREGKKAQRPSQPVFDAVAKVIDEWKDKDFGYYYLCDEPECRGISPAYLRYIYQFIKERDPYHVVNICSRDALRYIECTDMVEVHPYLAPCFNAEGKRVYGTELCTFGNYVEGVVALNRADKLIGCTPGAFAYDKFGTSRDAPTFEEYVACVWAILIEGGKSIYPFIARALATRPCLYEGVRYTFSSAAALEDMLLFGARRRLAKTETHGAAYWEKGGERMFAVVNFTAEPQAVELKGVKGSFGEFCGKRRWRTGRFGLSEGNIPLCLKPFETIIATTTPRDGGLPTYAEVQALVKRLEDERVRRDNQLLGRVDDLSFAASKPLGMQTGLFNGMYDDLTEHFRGDPWYEISFPKGAITFDRILLYGANLEKTTVKVRQKGVCVDLVPRSTERSESRIAFAFDRPVRTVKVRFAFHKDKVELNEIEFPHLQQPVDKPVAAKVRVSAFQTATGSSRLFHAENLPFTNVWSGEKWYAKDIDVRRYDDGSFSLGPSGATHAIVFDPKWKWIDFEIPRPAVKVTERGYSNWGLRLLKHPSGALCGNVRSCQTGLYTIPLVAIEKPLHGYVQVAAKSMHVPFSYIRFSEAPPIRLSVLPTSTNGTIRVGDRLRVALTLAEPCEDVTLSFNVDRVTPCPFGINGSSSMDLVCLDGEGRVWGGELEVKRLSDPHPRVGVYAKVDTLGGPRPLTVLTVIPGKFIQ